MESCIVVKNWLLSCVSEQPGQRKTSVLCKIHVVYFKNVFSGGQLSLAPEPQSFSRVLGRGHSSGVDGQQLFVALTPHRTKEVGHPGAQWLSSLRSCPGRLGDVSSRRTGDLSLLSPTSTYWWLGFISCNPAPPLPALRAASRGLSGWR